MESKWRGRDFHGSEKSMQVNINGGKNVEAEDEKQEVEFPFINHY